MSIGVDAISHAVTKDGRLGRMVGNKVFPNGFLEVRMRGDVKHAMRLVLEGEGVCKVTVNGDQFVKRLEDDESIHVAPAEEVRLVLRKAGRDYPLVRKLAVCRTVDAWAEDRVPGSKSNR